MKFVSKLLQKKAKTPNAQLGRIRAIAERSGATSWAIISPERPEASGQRQERHREFRAWIRSLGLGFRPIQGVWKDTVTGEISSEDSYFIPDISYGDTIKLMKAYDQQAVIYYGPETEGQILLIPDTVSDTVPLGKFTVGKDKEDTIYSEVKGRPFTIK